MNEEEVKLAEQEEDEGPRMERAMAWDLDIPIGLTLQAQLTTEKVRFRTQYLGMKQGDFLILQMPGIPSVRDSIVARCNLIVRFLIRGKVFGFESTVINHVMRPVPLMFLSFPTTIETINLRRSERVDTFIEADGEIGGEVVRGVITDISTGGCCLTIDRSTGTRWPNVDPGKAMLLKFTLPNQSESLIVSSEVINANKNVDSIKAGLRFVKGQNDGTTMGCIDTFVKSIMAFTSGKSL